MSTPLEVLRPSYSPLRLTTTAGAATQVVRVAVPAGSGMTIDVEVVAYRSTGVVNFFRRVIRARNLGGVIVIVSQNAPIPDDNPSGYAVDAAVLADGIGINVTGAGGQTVAWAVNLISVTH